MNEELIRYIENEIFPLYDRNEKGHGIEHIKSVIDKSFKLVDELDLDVNLDMVYTIASYHDLGHYIDSKKHEIISAEIFIEDINMSKWFDNEQINIIKEAIEDHRASSDRVPRSIYGKIVSTADRGILDIDKVIKRTYTYGLKHYTNFSYQEQLDRIYEHLTEKFGENGYAKIYLEDREYNESLKKLREALADKEEFMKRVKEVIKGV